jgi:LPPG:FO 2-phospho-L-lactate transferase
MALIDTSYWRDRRVVALAGGVGGAKLAHGLAQLLPAGQLTVVVNTGDDFNHYWLRICPDLDTVMYTLAGMANPTTGWGIQDETWQTLSMLEKYGETIWFKLGDRDIATHLIRTFGLANGETLTAITRRLSHALGIRQHILPATDDILQTIVHTQDYGELEFQTYFVKYRWQPTVTHLEFRGANTALASPFAVEAITNADAIIICPSNPLLSIAPMLAMPAFKEALLQRGASCIVVSPLIGGKAVKGPADKIMHELSLEASTLGIAAFYEDLIDGLVIDHQDSEDIPPVLQQFPHLKIYPTQTYMQRSEDRPIVAASVLNWLHKEFEE